ncbi:MAG: hypothetical protein MJZ46_01755 [Bacteroidales bacterium]|nr:hypothetical protein [Bacteroidales bacterium]
MREDVDQNKEKVKVKLPSLAFLVCIILSGLAWCFINFSKDQQQTFTYKLVCSSLPEGKKTCTLSDTTLLLTFSTKGLNYLTPRYAKENRVIDIAVSELVKNKPKRSAYTFSNKELCGFLQEQGYPELQFIQKPEVITVYIR